MSSAPPRPPSPPSSPPRGPADANGSTDSEPRSPTDPAARRPLGTALLALGAAGACMLMTSGPLWLTIAGMVSGVAALVFSVMALIQIRRAEKRTLILISVVVAVAVAGFGLLSGGVRLAFWNTVTAYESCVSQSVTISGQAACQEEMEDGLRGVLLPGLNT